MLLFETRAYDKAAIECNGREAVTNFDSSSYDGELMSEANNKGIIVGGEHQFKRYQIELFFYFCQ